MPNRSRPDSILAFGLPWVVYSHRCPPSPRPSLPPLAPGPCAFPLVPPPPTRRRRLQPSVQPAGRAVPPAPQAVGPRRPQQQADVPAAGCLRHAAPAAARRYQQRPGHPAARARRHDDAAQPAAGWQPPERHPAGARRGCVAPNLEQRDRLPTCVSLTPSLPPAHYTPFLVRDTPCLVRHARAPPQPQTWPARTAAQYTVTLFLRAVVCTGPRSSLGTTTFSC